MSFVLLCLSAGIPLAKTLATEPPKETNEKPTKGTLANTLVGEVYCGYELDASGDYWAMAIKVGSKNKEIFDVVWSRPLSEMPRPQDHTYRNKETLVLKSVDGNKVRFLRPTWRSYFDAELDSQGNLTNGKVFLIDKKEYSKNTWQLFKVK